MSLVGALPALPPALSGVGLKVRRFEEHFLSLEEMIEAYLEVHPYDLVSEVKANRLEREWRVTNVRHPAADFGLIIGDAVHNLRSSLDHLAYQLAMLVRTPPPRGTEFPIFRNGDSYSALDPAGKPRTGSGLFKVRGMPEAAKTLIEALQPFQAANALAVDVHPLWVLQELSNFDKHRLLTTTVIEHAGGGGFVPDLLVNERWFHNPLEENAVVISRTFSAPGQHVDTDVVLLDQVTLQVPGPQWGRLPVLHALTTSHAAVVAAVTDLAALFP